MYWIYEDTLCFICKKNTAKTIPLFRFFDGDFFRYTIDETIIPKDCTSDSIIGYVYIDNDNNFVPLYHLIDSQNGGSILCVSDSVKDSLMSDGYIDPVLFGYIPLIGSEKDIPLYYAINRENDDYFFTSDGRELDVIGPIIKRLREKGVKDPFYYQPVLINGTDEIDLIDILNQSFGHLIKGDTNPIILDSYYYCPSEETAQRIIDEFLAQNLLYNSQSFDCEDFCIKLKSAFIDDIYEFGVRTLPYCVGMITGQNANGGHAINVIVLNDGVNFVVKFVDPQIGKLVDPSTLILQDIELIFF